MLKIGDFISEDYETYVQGVEGRTQLSVVFPEAVLDGPQPFFWEGSIPPGAHQTFVKEHLFVPPIRLDVFQTATVCGAGLIFTQDGRVLHGHVPLGGGESQLLAPWTELDLQPAGEAGTFSCTALDAVEEVPRAISIARGAPGNYHHVLMDIAPRLRAVQKGLASGAFENFRDAPILVNTDTPDWALDICVRASGFDRGRFMRLPSRQALKVGELMAPHPLNNFAYWVSPETRTFYSGLYDWARSQSTAQFGDSIFTLRREVPVDRRRPHNVDEVARYLESRGFREVAPGQMSWADQIVAFSEARHVVAAMGSNVSNMIFSPPGASVLVLHPNDSVYSLNMGMAAAGGQRVGYAWCECFSNPERGEHVELYVDMDLLTRGVNALLSPAGRT